MPAVASAPERIATMEYTNPSDSSRRKTESIFISSDQAAWVGDRPDDAVTAARALATSVSMEVAIWREDDGQYWLFPIHGRDRHLPAQVIDAPNGVLRSSHAQLQAIVGAGTVLDLHGMVGFAGPDDPDEPWRDSYVQPGDPRIAR